MTIEPLYILYLDRYHMEDTVFLQRLARALAKRQRPSMRCLLLHGSGEYVERVLEGEGLLPRREGGVLQVDTEEQAELVARSVRQFNQRLVDILTDHVVACVGIQGTSRNLLWRQEGKLIARGAGWIETLLKQGVIPVVSATVLNPEAERVCEVAASEATLALVRALKAMDPRVVFFTRSDRPGLMKDGKIRAQVQVDELPESDVLAEPDAVRVVLREGASALLTHAAALEEAGEVAGTYVEG